MTLTRDGQDWLATRLEAGVAVIVVRVAQALGSTPRDEDAAMFVTAADVFGTVGGGSLEWTAIERARDMLRDASLAATWEAPLGPALGQCCGGRVTLSFARADAATLADVRRRAADDHARRPTIFVFGAGHVGRALMRALAPLPVTPLLIDSRADELAHAEGASRLVDEPAGVVADAPADAAVLALTHSHTLDFLIARAALARGDLAYVGMIGSATKRARFRSWLAASGFEPRLAETLVLPIGGAAVRDKRPEVIAALTAAELLQKLLAQKA